MDYITFDQKIVKYALNWNISGWPFYIHFKMSSSFTEEINLIILKLSSKFYLKQEMKIAKNFYQD